MTILQIVEASVVRAPWGWALTFLVALALIRVWPALRQMAIGEHARIREEYVAEIRLLREEVRELRNENDKLRQEIRGLHDDLSGYRRQAIQEQASALHTIGEVPPVIADAARRAEEALTKPKP